MRLDDLARTATESLLAHTTPDTQSRLADLRRIRRSRSIARTVSVAVAVAVAVAVGGWTVLRDSDNGKPEPAAPTYQNGALLIAGSDIRAVDGDGEQLRLPDGYLGDGDIAFTADGSELLYNNADQRIEAINVATGETRVVVPCGATRCSTSLSPDGRWLAHPEDDGIRLREVDGAAEDLLATPGVRVEQVAWSPDGEVLAFSGPTGIYTMAATGSAPQPLVESTAARTITLQWSPDGRTIAFVAARPLDFEQHGLRPERFVLGLVQADGDGLRDLHELGACICVRHPGPDFAWAPDGTAIAATRVTARREWMADVRSDGVYLITLDGHAERIAGGPGGRLAWQPVPAPPTRTR